MPTYEYLCSSCSHQWEEIQKITADPIEECPKCAEKAAKRQITGGNFILKGGGWYADAYSSKPAAKADAGSSDTKSETSSEAKTEKGDTKTETKTETKSETKSETKPETKAETKKAETKPPAS